MYVTDQLILECLKELNKQSTSLCNSGNYDVCESLVTLQEMKEHPWILLGRGVENRNK